MKKYTRKEVLDAYIPYVKAKSGMDIGTVPAPVDDPVDDPAPAPVPAPLDNQSTQVTPVTKTNIEMLSMKYDLPSLRTVQRLFKTMARFRSALGIPKATRPRQKPKKPLSDIITLCYEYLREHHSIWDVQRPYRYDDRSRPFPIALKNKDKKTELFEFIDVADFPSLEKEITRLEVKHKTIEDESRFYSKAYNVWIININREAHLTIEQARLKKNWALISTEDFRNIFKE